MTEKKGKAVANPAAAPVAAPVAQAPAPLEPLTQDAFKMVLGIIDRSDVKGSDAGNIILLKQELARVAGLSQNPAK